MSDDDRWARYVVNGFVACCLALAIVFTASFCGGCSALPVVTPTNVITVSCRWHAHAESVQEDNDCLIDRSSAEGETRTTGNETDAQVSPQTQVSAVP